jgi:hypothetical protein
VNVTKVAHPARFLFLLHSFPSFLFPIPVLYSEVPRSLIGHPYAPGTLEMTLLKRQTESSMVVDDQSLTLLNSYVGNWTHYPSGGFNNGTTTVTTTPGASLSFTFSGIQIIHVWPCFVALTLRWKQGPGCLSMAAHHQSSEM